MALKKPKKEVKERKNHCKYCDYTAIGESDLFQCPECEEYFCKEHMILVKTDENEVLCAFCAGDKS